MDFRVCRCGREIPGSQRLKKCDFCALSGRRKSGQSFVRTFGSDTAALRMLDNQRRAMLTLGELWPETVNG